MKKGIESFLILWLLLSPLLVLAPLAPKAAHAATVLHKPINLLGLQNGLMGWWTFDGPDVRPVIKDRSGQGNDGAVIGMATTTTVGKIGQALRFDGNGAVYTDNIPLSALTIAMWIKFDDTVATQRILDKSTTAPIVRLEGSSIQLIGSFITGSTNLQPNQWYHIAVTGSSAGQSVYINGTLDGFDGTAYSGDTTDFITLGGSIDPFVGAMDDARIYNRALSATEIAALYSSGAAKFASSADIANGSTLESGLVGHWTFDGKDMTSNVRDSSGQGNHGNLLGQTSTTTVIGKLGQALSFDGTNDRIAVSDINALDGISQFSASIWIYQDSLDDTIILSKYSGGGLELATYDASIADQLAFYIADGTSDCLITSPVASHRAGVWEHVVVVFDGSQTGDTNRVKIYIDGSDSSAIVDSNAGCPATTQSGNPGIVHIGWDESGSAGFQWNGKMDDARIYNRALSATEIAALYSSGAAKFASSADIANGSTLESGLVGHWTFDGKDMTSNVRDSSGQGYHAFLQNQNSTTTAIGKLGQALRFDGNNDYITNLGSGADTSAGAKNTVSFWMYWEGSTDSEVFGWGEGVSPNRDYSLWIPPSGACFGFNTTNSEVLGIGTSGLSGRWVHVAAVFHNGTPSAANNKLYIDGVAQSISYCAGVGSLSVTAGSQFWAGSYRGVGSGFLGKIDDLRIYDRELSASEVSQLYNLGR